MARSRSHLQQLAHYLRPYQRQVALGIGSLMLVNGFGVFLPWYIKLVIDDLSQNLASLQAQRIVLYALTVLVVSSLMMGIRIASRVWMFGVGRQVEFHLKQAIFEHLLTLQPSYFAQQTIGDILTRITSDVENIRRLLGFALLNLANTIFAYGTTLPAMFWINPRLSTLALSVFPVMLVLVKLTSARLQQQQLRVQQRLAELSDLIQEDINGITLIKVYGQEHHEQAEFRRQNQQLLQANLRLALTRNLLFPSLVALVSLSLLVLLAVGGPQIASGVLTIGDFSALTLYIERLVFPTALLGFTITAYQRGQVSLERIDALLAVEPTIQDAPTALPLLPESVRGQIEARGLTFSFADAKTPALDQLQFRIEPGQMVAIVGPIGAGKSTLANAIPHLLEIQPGQLFLDGRDITQIQLGSLRQAIAYVPQESFLFSATVRDNIRYGKPEAEDWEVELAAKAAHIHPEILNFPKGYDTLVGERGITLSGGQRQRVALARALLVDAPILILDDSLSSVDNQTAQSILYTLRHATAQKTVIFIAHRLTAVVDADQILVMEGGRIVQRGSHAELLADTEGLYASLWAKQKLEEVLV
ncbi:ABC transporter ATP-binding protein [Thermostichus vulcanus]|uniref:ABC transporter ATP-binding protein n=1 Tax=Thermostichus vulcanus str. 'Rupite' TaxID=2813851 RepID=A0ABT0C8G5_THEVL|nr:ABC transporter ATP-binding protein [Thermostichus vulcanus]MCJ2542086.1 ABC transporter ATP-binding protein [Thermostichus vulcanus str. 'Rupite']